MIRAYLSRYTPGQEHPLLGALESWQSNDPDFWVSIHYGESVNVCLVLINGDARDHTAAAGRPYLWAIDIDDLAARLDSAAVTIPANVLSEYNLSGLKNATTNRELVNLILRRLKPGCAPLGFGSKPKPSGTFYDDFTGTDGQALEARTGWTQSVVGDYTAEVLNNGLTFRLPGGSALSAWICEDQGTADHYVQAADTYFNSSNSNESFLCARLVDTNNFIAYHLGGTGSAGARLCVMTGGVFTDSLVSTQGGAGYVWKIECEGSTVRLFRDTGGGFVQVGADQTITDHQTETSAGFVNGSANQNNAKYDLFECGAVAAGAPAVHDASPLTMTGAYSGSPAVPVSITAPVLLSSGVFGGDPSVGVLVPAAVLSGAGQFTGAPSVPVGVPAAGLFSYGQISGGASVAVQWPAVALAALSSIQGTGAAGGAVLHSAVPLQLAGAFNGAPSVGVWFDSPALSAVSALSGAGDIVVVFPSQPLSGVSSILGTPVTGGAVVHSAAPLIVAGALTGAPSVPVGWLAPVLSGVGLVSGAARVPVSVPAMRLDAVMALSGVAGMPASHTAAPLVMQSTIFGSGLAAAIRGRLGLELSVSGPTIEFSVGEPTISFE